MDSRNGNGGGFDWGSAFGAGAGLLSGLFTDSGAPYDAAMDQMQKYLKQAQGFQNPFYNAGTGAIPKYQGWLDKMQNPTDFINNLMGQYQQSPASIYRQQQALRAATNAGSASGLTGSTPLTQQIQQNAADISSEDMDKWLSNVLGINTQYGTGQQNLMNQGANSANALTNLLGSYGKSMGEAAYGQKAAQNNSTGDLIGNIASIASLFF
jgi:hypothetical protein